MNAYELADEITPSKNEIEYGGFVDSENWQKFINAANMLRQQADRIAELEKAKTLTDEEIKQIFGNETGFDIDSGCFRGVALIDFARAILRKAQEK